MATVANKIRLEIPSLAGLEAHVGNTPLLPLRRVGAGLGSKVQVLAKAEWFNPGGSVKDRPALNILHAALERGELTPGRRLLDSTSGNMGISYATFGASLGIGVTLALPANASPERIAILKALGAELVLTDPSEGSDGAIRVARKMAADFPDRYFYANQYDNPANWQAHYYTTGPEIVADTAGAVTHFLAGLGTSGTLTGVGRYLREINPAIQVIGIQPDQSLHGIEGLKHMPTAIRPGIYDPAFPDRILPVQTEAAYAMVRRLGREEGLFVGISSGAAAVAALQLAAELEQGVVVTLFPDAGYKYLSDKEIWGGGYA
ncbi:MAG TPA: cysteine synthase family protein [Anaerolineales bacterium]|nr:cysteine synthase family protein [Anaerolineales bacterium]